MEQSTVERLLGRDRLIVIGSLVIGVAISGGFILSGAGTGMSSIDMSADTGPAGALISGMPDMVSPVVWTPRYAVVVFVMWWLMMVAMMVPSAAPVVLLYGALHRERGAWGALEFLSGYLAAWAGFSLMATAVQGFLSASGLVSAMYMNLASTYLAAAVLVGAGLYQLTPMKFACLAYCRGPVEGLTRHRRTGYAAAFRMGLLHGAYCLGCCWALPGTCGGLAMQKLADKALVLVTTAILLGIVPQALMLLGIRGFAIGLTFFLLNLALCAAGLMTRRFRVFLYCWAVAWVAFFLLFGMATPVGMMLVLPRLASNWI